MIRLFVLAGGLWALVRRMVAAHLQVVNDGSPAPESAFLIADVTLAQAFYGRLTGGGGDYYRFTAAAGTPLRLSLLVPERWHSAGCRPTIVLRGAGLPAGGLELPPGDAGTRAGTTLYRRTQRHELMAAGGDYELQIQAATGGVYCFCVGSREPDSYADATTRARVRALLEE